MTDEIKCLDCGRTIVYTGRRFLCGCGQPPRVEAFQLPALAQLDPKAIESVNANDMPTT